MKLYYVVLLLFSISLISFIKNDSVCDLETLKLEILQDISDNKMLDCQRKINPPHSVIESEEERNLRIAAQWDTSCSFEADSLWIEELKKNYKVSQLVDSLGEPVDNDFEDQADMCEIIRAAYAKNAFDYKEVDMQNVPKSIIDKIQCAGAKGDNFGPQICAATSGSFFNKGGWNILNKSSGIKFANKPNFIEKDPISKEPGNPWANLENLPEPVNDLAMLSKDQLENSAPELKKLIDDSIAPKKERKDNGPEDTADNHDKNDSIHYYFKKIDTEIPKSNTFMPLQNGELKFKNDGAKLLLGAYTFSTKSNEHTHVCLKMSLNEYEVPISRQCHGNVNYISLGSSFIEKISSEEVKLNILGVSGASIKIVSDGDNSNLTFGGITLPDNGFYNQKTGLEIFPIKQTTMYVPFKDLAINVSVQENYPVNYLVVGNISLKLKGESKFGAIISLNSKEIDETAIVRGKSNFIGINLATVLECFPGSNNISIKYKYDGEEFEMSNADDNGKLTQNMSAIQLPKNTSIQTFKPSGSISFNAGSWMPFNLRAKIECSTDTDYLILFHVNVKVNGALFAVRVKVNGKTSFKSTLFKVKDEEYATHQGYFIKKLKKGSYDFDLEYYTDSSLIFDPVSEKTDKQSVNLKIISFPN